MKFRRLFRNNVLRVLTAVVFVLAAGGGWWWTHRQPAIEPQPKANTATKAASTVVRNDLLSGGWDTMPGTTMQKDGLQVQERNFAIVNQDGSGGQPNPPLNLYGKRLVIDGAFSVTAKIAAPASTKASLRLYGGVPTIMDESRIEPRSLRFTLNGTQLTVERWDANTVQPSVTLSFTVQPTAHNTLVVTRQNGQVSFTFNGQAAGSVSENNVFGGGAVWFGLESQGGNWLLEGLDAVAAAGGRVTAIDVSAAPAVARDPNGLQGMASKKRPGFLIGAAAALAPATADDAYRQTLFGNFGLITTENALKWQFVHPAPGVYDFHEADALVNDALKNGLKVHGHTLVFGEANPHWVQNLPANQREGVMLDHIKTVVGHFKGRISSWDVVNEPFDDDTWDGLRPHLWEQAMGESYINKAFTAAHQADPNALLFVNDYGLEEDGDRWNAMLALVTKLKKEGVPINGVGFEAHVYASGDKINAAVLQRHIQQLAAIGLKARVSEMDVYSEDGQATQASQYSQVLQACLAESNCISFTTWGVSDRYDWFKDDDGSVQQGEDLLWDKNMAPTPAVSAMLQVLR